MPTRAEREAEERRVEREARQSTRRRVFRLRVGAAVAAIVLLAVGCVSLYNSPLFRVTRVEVVGTERLDPGYVRSIADVPSNATLIRFPAAAVAKRVAADDWVRSVTVSRVFPDGMRIRVVERKPVAMVDAANAFWLIDSHGVVIAKRSIDQTPTSIVVRDVPGLDLKAGRRTTSEPLLNAIAVLGTLSAQTLAEVRTVSAPTVDGTTLYTADKIEIVFGDATDGRIKDQLARDIIKEHPGKVVSIDVRTIDHATWRGVTK